MYRANTNIRINAAGTETTVIDADVTLEGGTQYTVIASNFLASITPLVLVDDPTAPAAGNVRVRVVHNAPSAPSVDVYVSAPGEDIETLEPVLTGVPFAGVSDYLEIAAGDYQIRVTITETTTVAIDTGTLTLAEGSILTVVAIDAEGGGAPFSVITLDDSRP